LVADKAGVPFAVAGRPTPDELLSIAKSQIGHQPGRIALAGLPVNLEAGPPAWSSYCDKLAYVVADDLDQAFPVAEEVKRLRGSLVAAGVSRRDWDPDEAARQAAYIEEARAAASNLKNIMMALMMFAEDHGGMLPDAEDAEELSEILAPYVKGAGVFARPGDGGDVVVEYLVMPGTKLAEIEDPQLTAIAIVDYHPMFYVVGYADGHVRLFHR
jgi:hypothetical protein